LREALDEALDEAPSTELAPGFVPALEDKDDEDEDDDDGGGGGGEEDGALRPGDC
jgi:hypothetical protein